ncbi:uncharacterized protein JCM15063_002349 [Sporobolomyces koalae]|uniref:uncharacterized protein n=1 Tax=Sporobolomyces koalae TaxID=500713 RepID=UPI00316E6C1B
MAALSDAPLPSTPGLAGQLLIAQAVYSKGTRDWNAVSSLLDDSPEWPPEEPKLTDKGLETAFVDMMRNRALDPAACTSAQARPVKALIHALYSNLLTSIRDSLVASHARQIKLAHEVAQIESGQLDSALLASAPPAVQQRFKDTAAALEQEQDHQQLKALANPAPDQPGEPRDEVKQADSRVTPHAEAEEDPKLEPEDDAEVEASEEAGDEEDAGESTSNRRSRTTTGRQAAAKSSVGNKRKASEPTTPATVEDEQETPASKRKRVATTTTTSTTGTRKSRTTDTADPAESGSEAKESKQTVSKRKQAFQRIVDQIRTSLPFSNAFESKITRSIAPNYQSAVRNPTCLKDVSKAIKNGEIRDSRDLMKAFAILCANAVQFNGDEGEGSIGRQAKELWVAFEQQMNETLSTEFNMGDA